VTQPGALLGHGREADIFAWNEGRLLKLYISPDRRDDAEHEARVTTAAGAAGCPAPRCFGLAEVNGRTGLVLERLTGPMLTDLLLAGPDPAAALRQLARLQAGIHQHEIPGLSPLHARLSRRIKSVRAVAGSLADTALNRLERLPEGRALCHWDLHPGNVIVTGSGPVVIDWSGASSGNPLADVARSLFLLADAPLMNDAPPELVSSVARARAAGVDPYLECYCSITGTARADIAAWRLPVLVDRLADGIPEERILILRLARTACDCRLFG
jgi:aminoglycoside phosphotransferase (APT) family kinase protein